ncbi:MAG: WD40 repeat domain-containing protein, partial [Cyanobacteria bacterium J06555_13]
NTIKIWRVRDGKLIRTLTGHQNGVTGLAFFPEGDVLVSGSADEMLKVWDFHTGELLNTLQGHRQAVEGISLSADGRLLISNGDNLEVQLWAWTLAEILGEGCRQLGSYLATNPNVLEKNICE